MPKHTAGNLAIALDPGSTDGDPQVNLARLEDAARQSIAFGADLPFDAPSWEIQPATLDRRRVKLWFTVHRDGDSEAAKDAALRSSLQEPFAAFLKSIIRLSEAADPSGGPERHEALLRAARYLYDQLEDRAYDPSRLTNEHFVRAEMAAVCRDDKEWSHFAVAQNLLKLASLVSEYRLSRAAIAYVPETPPPDQEPERRQRARAAIRLPSTAALDTLPKIAQLVKDPADVCMMRTIELLHCAPLRIGEVLSLPASCEVVMSPDGRLLTTDDLDSGAEVRYGLRYKPEKNPGLASDVKWIPSAVVPLARRALEDIRRHTAEARQIAAYMEDNPGRAWMPEQFRELESLALDQVAEILERPTKDTYLWLRSKAIPIRPEHVLRDEFERGLSNTLSAKANERALIRDAEAFLRDHRAVSRFDIKRLKEVIRVRDVYRWLRVKGIPVHPDSVSRQDLEARTLKMNKDVSADFPWKRSECLFLFPKQFFKMERPFRSVVALMGRDQLRYFMAGQKKTEKTKREYAGIFKRMGFAEPDGRDIHVTSHMFRRWLATLALDRKMSAEQVQNWLGHTSERTIRSYDYRTPDALAEDARTALGQGIGIGPIAEIARSKQPRDRDTFLEAVLATAHITPYGMCARDWISSPCSRHGACVACDKQTILKGDPEHRAEIVRSLRENRILLERAKAEHEDGQVGADNYVRHLERELAVLEATLARHEDPSIADGTIVQLDLPTIVPEAAP